MREPDLEAGTTEHYVDAALYDHEYRRRRADVNFYRSLASEVARGRKRGARILELGCGTGRLMMALLRDGHRVVGIDRSAEMLARAHARLNRVAALRGRGALLRADIRQFELRREFDLILCVFNTFQHLYHRADVAASLACVRSHLARTGRFSLDVMNPDVAWLARDPDRRWARTRFVHPRTGAPTIYSTNHRYDRVSQVNHIRIYYEPPRGQEGPSQVVSLAHRMFFPEELLGLVERAGLTVVRRHGDFHDQPLEDDSEQQVLVCRSPRSRASAGADVGAHRRKTLTSPSERS